MGTKFCNSNDWFFLLDIEFCDFQRVTLNWNYNIFRVTQSDTEISVTLSNYILPKCDWLLLQWIRNNCDTTWCTTTPAVYIAVTEKSLVLLATQNYNTKKLIREEHNFVIFSLTKLLMSQLHSHIKCQLMLYFYVMTEMLYHFQRYSSIK